VYYFRVQISGMDRVELEEEVIRKQGRRVKSVVGLRDLYIHVPKQAVSRTSSAATSLANRRGYRSWIVRRKIDIL